MLKRLIHGIGVACLAVAAVGWAQDVDVDQLTRQLKGEEAAPERTPEQLVTAYSTVVESLLPAMGAEKTEDRKNAQQSLQRVCWHAGRPGAEPERAAVCAAIGKTLAGELAVPAREWLIKQLEHIGRAESVTVLATQFADTDSGIRECARRALARNPALEAAAALQAALAKAKAPAWQLALINALKFRRDQTCAAAVAPLAQSAEDAVRTAAVQCLGELGDAAHTETMAAAMSRGSDAAKAAAVDAYLLLADTLCGKGDKTAALAMYRGLLDKDGHVRCAAIVGLGRAGSATELPLIFSALESEEAQTQGAGLDALALLPAADVATAIARKFETASAHLKLALVTALARNGEVAVLPTLVKAARDEDEAVKIAALHAMGLLRSAAAAVPLAEGVATLQGSALDAAKKALAVTPGVEVVNAIGERFKTAETPGQVELVRCLQPRRSKAALALLFTLAGSATETDVRLAALDGLRKLAQVADLAALVELLLRADNAKEREAAQKAIVATSTRAPELDQCAAPLLARLDGAPDATRALLLRALGQVGGTRALEAVESALTDANKDVQDAAVRALADWPDLLAADELLRIVKEDPNLVRKVLAMRGYVRIVREADGPTADEKLAMLKTAMAAAPRVDEQKLVLGGYGDLVHIEALQLAAECVRDPALAKEACVATAKIAEAVAWEHPQKTEEMLTATLPFITDEKARTETSELIAKIHQYADHIPCWLAAGPYQEKGKKRADVFEVMFAPEQEAPAKPVEWKEARTGTKPEDAWFVDLAKVVGKKSHQVAYVRTWIRSADERLAQLETGSDDGAVVWLNGEEVARSNEDRATVPGQDKAEVALRKGWNDLMIKVSQAGGQWSVCARFRDPAGGPVPGLLLLDSKEAVRAAIEDLAAAPIDANALDAAWDMAMVLGSGTPKDARELMRKLSQALPENDERKEDLVKRLDELEGSEDMILDWEYAGPYFESGKGTGDLFKMVYSPEPEGKGDVEWQPVTAKAAGSTPGVFDVNKFLNGSNRTVYVRATMQSATDQEAQLQIGSDDGVKAWLNGELVHAHSVARPVRQNEDKVDVALKEGTNTLLLKVVQGGGGWGWSARFRARDGGPLPGTE